ncbi:MAG: HAD-IIB family hydrolase [Gammaproteobacteria bacterium]|nr:HAD-IIB family hydrolase [Gammaproteobacteria bacterium]
MTRLLLCTDLDRTLLPNGTQPESEQARELFSQLVARPEVTLVYVTGRDPMLIEEAFNEYTIPRPDYVIADVGASIYQLIHTKWQHWPKWDNHISRLWGAYCHADLKLLLQPIRELELQEESKQSAYKLSYYVSLQIPHELLLQNVTRIMAENDVNANLIWSIDEQKDIGLLDILPGNAGKREAIEFLMTQLGFNYDEVVFAGDSGNDISVMSSPVQAVLVANASEEVKQAARQQAEANGCVHQLYLAKGDFHGLNGNYSSGILEGVAHYMNQVESWLWSKT